MKRLASGALTAILAAAALTACAEEPGAGSGGEGGGDADTAKVAFLMPDLASTRYEQYDAPLFEAKMAELCPDCEVLYQNADSDAAGVRFLPYLSPAGERNPFLDPAARGSLTGLSLDAGRADVARAVVDGLTMTVRECLAAAGPTPTSLALCGGGAASAHWSRLIADVTGIPVIRSTDTQVGTRGAQLVALVATSAAPDLETAAERHLELAAAITPDPDRSPEHDERYAEFLALRAALAPTWHREDR